MSAPTPHNSAISGDFAKTVLMPGDPLRAKFIAETYLSDVSLVNNVRGIHGYTGTYQKKPISVMASGMGMPSIAIYSYELFSSYNVENIIRIGSAGALCESVMVRDIVVGLGACTNSNFASTYKLNGTFAPTASYKLLKAFCDIAEQRKKEVKVGNLLSSDTFYGDDPDYVTSWSKMGVLAVEMEAAALYMNAARLQKNALAVCTISDHLITGEALDSTARQTTFTDMMELALKTAVALD